MADLARIENKFWVVSYVTLDVAKAMLKQDRIDWFEKVTEDKIIAERQVGIDAEAKRKADEVKRLEAEIKAEEKKAEAKKAAK